MQEKKNYRDKAYYERKLLFIMPTLVEMLAEGKNIELCVSRSGVKMFTNDRHYVELRGIKKCERGVKSGE